MTANGWVQLGLYLVLLLLLVRPLGEWMAHVLEGRRTALAAVLGPLERVLYRAAGVDPQAEMTWQTYARAMLAFNALGFAATYACQRLQHRLPWNPQHLGPVGAGLAFNTAVSFATNTNWQSYGGETTM